MRTKKDFGLGRLPAKDERDRNFLVSARHPLMESERTYRYWWSNGWWGDQGKTSQCVGYGWTHFLEDGEVTHNKVTPPLINPAELYKQAQEVDEWLGNDYDGTSVRAGAKVLQQLGMISEYHWAYDNETLLHTVLEVAPVVVGTNWYSDMFEPNSLGKVKIGGALAGGHCYVINGVNKTARFYRCKNSWSRQWGRQGYFFLSFDDMERLISEDGEFCLATEIPD